MFSKIVLNSKNLLSNFDAVKKVAGGEICVMVKANAYGHGAKEIVKILGGRVKFLGVSNMTEAEEIRPLTSAEIIVFGACENYEKCMQENISFALLSLEMAKKVIKIAKKLQILPKMHLCINSGMNRYGVKTLSEFDKIVALLLKNNIPLHAIYTHFSSLTTDKIYTQKQRTRFDEFCSHLPREWHALRHVGGGNSIFENLNADFYRVGLEIYGYGSDFVKPVLSVKSQIVSVEPVRAGEHVGYLCGYTAERDMTVATIPLGYGDGFPRKLSNNLTVVINNKVVKNVGNICMDAFMVDVTGMKVKPGDSVTIFESATPLAKLEGTTEYEVLTNLTKFRGERVIS